MIDLNDKSKPTNIRYKYDFIKLDNKELQRTILYRIVNKEKML